MTKTCTRCNLTLPISNFSFRDKTNNKYQSWCKKCHKSRYSEWYNKTEAGKAHAKKNLQRNRDAKLKYKEITDKAKDTPCADCDIKYPPYVMDFDHLRDKLFNISASCGKRSIKQLKEEILKCEVVCANCHRERTHGSN